MSTPKGFTSLFDFRIYSDNLGAKAMLDLLLAKARALPLP